LIGCGPARPADSRAAKGEVAIAETRSEEPRILAREGGSFASRRSWLWPALALLLALAPVLFWDGGVIEEEALAFQRNFWDDSRPVPHRIFETREFDDYQGRELSYAIDCLDAQWIRALLSRGIFIFVATSVLLASLALVPIGMWLVPDALPGLEPGSRWLVLLLYLSNFAVASTTGLLYRATKPLVAPLLLVLLLLLVAELRRPRLGRVAAFLATFATALVMSLLDRQGLFYVLVLAGVLCLAWLRTRRGFGMLLALAVAILACFLYNDRLGPWLIHSLNGYWPDRRFEQLDPRWLLSPGPWVDGTRLLGDWTRVLVGGVPPGWILAAAAVAAGVWAWHERGNPRRIALTLAVAGAAAISQTSMVAMMVARYSTITWIDHRFWYYPLPYQALLVFGMLWGLERLALARGSLPRLLPIVIATLVIANVAQWPERRYIMQSGPWFSGVERRSSLLVRSWRNGQPDLLLDGEYRRFYFETLILFPRLAAGAGAYVAEGDGVGLVVIRDGRLRGPARREAHLPVTAKRTGPHVLIGGVFLRPGTTLSIRLGPRRLAELRADHPQDGPLRFRIRTNLAAGRSDLALRARLPKDTGGGRRGFELQLPFLVWHDEDAPMETVLF
jgi:hypothetical protein